MGLGAEQLERKSCVCGTNVRMNLPGVLLTAQLHTPEVRLGRSSRYAGLFLPLFDELPTPRSSLVCPPGPRMSLARGVWDHLRWQEPIIDVADPWITHTAIATATERVRVPCRSSAASEHFARSTAASEIWGHRHLGAQRTDRVISRVPGDSGGLRLALRDDGGHRVTEPFAVVRCEGQQELFEFRGHFAVEGGCCALPGVGQRHM
jgi:hypothetical protein